MQRGRMIGDTGIVIPRARLADRIPERLRGLLGRPRLQADEAFVIPTQAVHTVGMRYPLDLLYLDAGGRILRAVRELRPGRLGPVVAAARWVVELPPGTLDRLALKEGDRLQFEPSAPDPAHPA